MGPRGRQLPEEGQGGGSPPATTPPRPAATRARLTSAAGMLTTPVERRFSRSFLFSICPLPFLALGPELLFFSGAPSRCSSSPGAGGAPAAAAARGSSSGRRGPGAARLNAAGPTAQFTPPGAAGAAAPPAGLLLSSWAAPAAEVPRAPGGGFPAASPLPPPGAAGPGGFCLARSFSRFAFHSSRKSVVLPLPPPPVRKPPVAIFPAGPAGLTPRAAHPGSSRRRLFLPAAPRMRENDRWARGGRRSEGKHTQ